MSAGQTVVIKFGMHCGKRAEVLAVGTRTVTVRGSFGTATYGLREVEVHS